MKQKKAKDLSTNLTQEQVDKIFKGQYKKALEPPTPPQWYLEEHKSKHNPGKFFFAGMLIGLALLFFAAGYTCSVGKFRPSPELLGYVAFSSMGLIVLLIAIFIIVSRDD
jgi:hypothetical protein